jgi:hypothetical protein
MRKRIGWDLATLAFLTVLCWTARARAQEPPPEQPFGRAGQWTFAVENAVGVDYVTDHRTSDAQIQSTDTIDLSVSPRAGVDRFVSHGLSVGGSLRVYRSTSHLQTATAPTPAGYTVTIPNVTTTNVDLGPRVGYAARLSGWLSLWPRAGITFLYGDTSFGSTYVLDVSVDAPLVFRVAPHAALTVGPSFDRTLWSKSNTTITTGVGVITGSEHDTITEVGLHAGLLVTL